MIVISRCAGTAIDASAPKAHNLPEDVSKPIAEHISLLFGVHLFGC